MVFTPGYLRPRRGSRQPRASPTDNPRAVSVIKLATIVSWLAVASDPDQAEADPELIDIRRKTASYRGSRNRVQERHPAPTNDAMRIDGRAWHARIETFKFITRSLLSCVLMMLGTPALSQIQGEDNLPVLYGIKLSHAQIAIDVVSFGCTDASYFSVQLDPAPPDAYRLSVIQRRRDRCRMASHIVTLTLDIPAIANLTTANFFLVNRLGTPVTLPRSDL